MNEEVKAILARVGKTMGFADVEGLSALLEGYKLLTPDQKEQIREECGAIAADSANRWTSPSEGEMAADGSGSYLFWNAERKMWLNAPPDPRETVNQERVNEAFDPSCSVTACREFRSWRVYGRALDGREVACSFPTETKPTLYDIADAARNGNFKYI